MQPQPSTYSQMLDIQCDMTFKFEQSLYEDSTYWQEAKSVLDIGSGNGTYITKLQTLFPDKEYTGIDINEELVAIAKKGNPKIRFISGLLNEKIHEKYDVILMRLIINTIPDRLQFFEELKNICHEKTWIVITDAEDSHFKIVPNLPYFLKSLEEARKNASQRGATRKLREKVREELLNFGFKQLTDSDYSVSSLQSGKETMRKYMGISADLVAEEHWKQERDSDLDIWENNPDSSASFGLFTQTYMRVQP